jgi:hypothetical protein
VRGTGIHGNCCIVGGTIDVFTDYCHFLVLCISSFLPPKKHVFYPYGLSHNVKRAKLRTLIAYLTGDIAYWTRQAYGVGTLFSASLSVTMVSLSLQLAQ